MFATTFDIWKGQSSPEGASKSSGISPAFSSSFIASAAATSTEALAMGSFVKGLRS